MVKLGYILDFRAKERINVICSRCSVEVSESLVNCSSCATFAGYPNVRIAQKPEESEALEARYFQALVDAESRGALSRVEEFEAEVMSHSQAVVAMDIETMRNLMANANELYSNYQLSVRAERRKPAPLAHDQRRISVDGRLWGGFGDQIRYAALSLDKKGLSSYGACFGVLRNLNVELRSSVLETNAFEFVETIPSEPLPLGYRSDWWSRHKVAVAKCACSINVTSSKAEFASILLSSCAGRTDDDFIEVHIYGPFDFQAFEAIGTSGKVFDRRDQLTLEIIEQKDRAAGKTWLS